jgi:DNA polymerase III subunit delta'
MWDSIIGQEKVKEKLKSAFKTGRVSHAYLFYGNEGTGKDAAAIEFARLIDCMNPVNREEACGKCDNCVKISEFRSEYFRFICALPAGKSEQTDSDPIEKLASSDFEAYMEQINIKAKNPYHRISIPGANNIRINSVRNLISKSFLSTSRSYKKIFIISEADKMRQEAANALLKILEEPPRNSVLILTTSKMNMLPQTVIGRCQAIHFEPLNDKLIKEKILSSHETKNNYPDAEVTLASKLCFGSYSRAIELLQLGISEIRDTAIKFLISVLTNEYSEIVTIIRATASKNNKDKLKYFLFFLNVWFRDLLKMKYSQDHSKTDVANFDVKDRLERFNGNYPDTDIYSVIIELEESEKYITQNVQLQLILLNLSFKLKKLIR